MECIQVCCTLQTHVQFCRWFTKKAFTAVQPINLQWFNTLWHMNQLYVLKCMMITPFIWMQQCYMFNVLCMLAYKKLFHVFLFGKPCHSSAIDGQCHLCFCEKIFLVKLPMKASLSFVAPPPQCSTPLDHSQSSDRQQPRRQCFKAHSMLMGKQIDNMIWS